MSFVLTEPTQIEFHLAGIGWLEIADLEFDRDEPTHSTVKEQQVDVVIVAVESDSFLTL